MRDQQGGRACLVEDVAQFHRQAFAQVRIQVRERFVEQKKRRFRRKCPRQRDPLLLAARQFVREALGKRRHADQREHPRDAAAPMFRRRAAQAERNVVGDIQMGKQRVVLEDHAHTAPLGFDPGRGGRDHAPIEPDLAGIDAMKAGDRTQRRRLAAPGRTEQAADLAAQQLEAKPVDDRHASARRVERNGKFRDAKRHRDGGGCGG